MRSDRALPRSVRCPTPLPPRPTPARPAPPPPAARPGPTCGADHDGGPPLPALHTSAPPDDRKPPDRGARGSCRSAECETPVRPLRPGATAARTPAPSRQKPPQHHSNNRPPPRARPPGRPAPIAAPAPRPAQEALPSPARPAAKASRPARRYLPSNGSMPVRRVPGSCEDRARPNASPTPATAGFQARAAWRHGSASARHSGPPPGQAPKSAPWQRAGRHRTPPPSPPAPPPPQR